MESNNILNKYVEEVLKPQLGKGGSSAPAAKKPESSSDSGEEGSAKRVRQAVYDIRYRARREDVPLEQAFSQYMGNTSMNAVEKKAVKEKLGIGPGGKSTNEEVDVVSEEEKEKTGAQKFQVRVTDKLTGKSYVRMATRQKINQLRANKNIGSVEMTKYGSPYEGEKKKGKQTAAVTSGKGLAKKDYDGDGKVESGAKEYRGAVHNAIQRKKGGKADGKDTSNVKEATSADIEVPSKDLAKLAKKASKRIDTNVSGDVNKKDKTMGDYGEFVPSVDGKKRVTTKIGESYSDWRLDLSEVIDDDIASKKKNEVKEKKVNNYSGKGKCVKIEPELAESMQEIGGEILEVTEVISEETKEETLNIFEGIETEEFFFMDEDLIEEVVAEVFFESIQEGYSYQEVEESILSALDDYSVELSEDYYDSAVSASKAAAKKIARKKRAEKVEKVKASVKKVAKDFASGAKKAIKGTAYRSGAAVKSGAKAAAKGAVRGAGYAAGAAKRAADTAKSEFKKGYDRGSKGSSSSSDSDSDSGSSSGSYRIKYKTAKKKEGMFSKLKKGLKKAVGKASRSLSKGADKVATKMGESAEIGEAVSQISGREKNPPAGTTAKQDDVQQKQMLANKKKMMMKQQMLQKQRLQMQQQGKLPMGHAAEGYAPGDVDQKVGAVTSIPKSEQDAARARIIAKTKAKREKMKEETEDSLRDRRQERGGVDGNVRYDRAPKAPNTKKFGTGKTMAQKEMEKKYGKGASAMDIVKAQIRAKHGKGAIMDTKRK